MGPFKDAEKLTELCDQFIERHFKEKDIRQWCESGGLPSKVYKDFYDCGLGKYVLPIVAGGYDVPFTHRAYVLEHLTRAAGATLPIQVDMLTWALLASMREQSQMEIFEDLAPEQDGTVMFSQAFTEIGAGSDAQAVQTVVSLEDGRLYLDGVKTFVSYGQFAKRALVLVRDPICGQQDGGMSLWLVSLDLPGVSTMPINTIGQEMLCPAAVRFEHVLLDPMWQIQTEGKLNAMLKRQFAYGRMLVCASTLGLAKAAMDDALGHAAQHKIKGRALASLPQIQDKLAGMEVKIRAMDSFLTEACIAAGGRASDPSIDMEDLTLKTTLMKSYTPKASTEVASDALQIFGGIGYTDESRVSRIWKDCRGNQIAQGTDEVMVHYISTTLVRQASEGKLTR